MHRGYPAEPCGLGWCPGGFPPRRPSLLAGAVPDHCLGVPHGVGEWSGTAEAHPRRGSSQAGRATAATLAHTVAARGARRVCGGCTGPVWLLDLAVFSRLAEVRLRGWCGPGWARMGGVLA